MELHTGVDILKISRLENSIQTPRFLQRVYGEKELAIYSENPSIEFLAGNFCAKEAFSKAIGTGIRGFSLNEVEILRDSLGAPYFYLSGKASEIINQKKLSFSVSISHEKEYAIAFVCAWKI